MAIQVSGTTVINNSRVLQNVSGLRTINGSSLLGSGDISAGGDFTWSSYKDIKNTVTGMSGAREIVIGADSLAAATTNHIELRIGDSGGIETSGYDSIGMFNFGGAHQSLSDAFYLAYNFSYDTGFQCVAHLYSRDGTKWAFSSQFSFWRYSTKYLGGGAGAKTLSSGLDRVQIITTNNYNHGGGDWWVGWR